jgi:hypothetical protein
VFPLLNGGRDQANGHERHDAIIALAPRRRDQGGLAEVLRRQFPHA